MLSELDKEIILALADNGMKAKTAARQMGKHFNVIYYHMDGIYMQTNLDPRNFYDLHKLVEMAREEN